MRPTRTLAAGCALTLAAAPLTIATTATTASAQQVTPARVAGENRYATAAEVARFLYPDGVSEAVLGSGLDFPDALAGAPLAGANNAPVLLTDPDQVPAATLAALDDLGVNQVTLLGGEAAISAAVAQDLESRGYVVGRVAGANRYETAAELARAVYAENAGANFPGGRRAVFVANGMRFPDALAASAPASSGPAQIPIVLVEQDWLPGATAQVLDDLDVDLAILVGGTDAVSESVRQAIEDSGVNTDRIGGRTRTDTATNVAAFAQEFLGFDATSYLLARGDAFPDALAAGPLGGARQDPILLTAGPDTLSSPTSTFLASQCPAVEVVRAVGGPHAVSVDVLNHAEQAAQSCAGGDGEAPAFPAAPQPSSQDASADARLAVSDVRIGSHEGFDRVVFDLGGTGSAGWQVEYRDSIQEQGSGQEVDLAGDASLRVLIRGTVAPPSTDQPYYDGPDMVQPTGTSNVQEVYMGTWFEGIYDAAIGLQSEQPFRVYELSNPKRLVIDVLPPDGQQAQTSIAAVDVDGRAVLLDPTTGQVRRVLLDGITVDDPADNGIAVTPDRSTVFVVRPTQSGPNDEIVQISAAGGEPHLTIAGQSPAVSPDGSTLAYVHNVASSGPGQPSPTLRLRDLATGTERELAGGDFYAIHDLTWMPDSHRIAFTAGEIEQGVHVVSRDAASLTEARRLGPDNLDASWNDVATLGDETLAVVERCCSIPDPEQWRVVSVDVSTGNVGNEVFGRDRTEASFIDHREDAEGIVVLRQVRPAPEGGTLLRWDGSDGLAQVRDGIIAAAW